MVEKSTIQLGETMNNDDKTKVYFKTATELRTELARLILAKGSASVTHRVQIEDNLDEVHALKDELIRHGFLQNGHKWVGELVNFMGAIERVMNVMGYATKTVRRTRNGRMCKELACTLNRETDIESTAKARFRERVIGDIEREAKTLLASVAKLKQIEQSIEGRK